MAPTGGNMALTGRGGRKQSCTVRAGSPFLPGSGRNPAMLQLTRAVLEFAGKIGVDEAGPLSG